MEKLQAFFGSLPHFGGWEAVDVLVVACMFYILLPIFKSTGTTRIVWVAVIMIALASLANVLNLRLLSFILNELLTAGLLALVVLFQPELRRSLDHVSKLKLKGLLAGSRPSDQLLPVIEQTVRACETMGRERVGALIVFSRDNSLEEYFKTGTLLDAQVSEQLIRNVFFPKASLHDGAMIIRNGRVAAAGCVLPLSESDRLHADLGTRHRAGVGMSEASDAVVVIVSEETGVISAAVGGVLKRHLAPQTLEQLLRRELCPDVNTKDENPVVKLRQKLNIKKNTAEGGKDDAQ